MAGRRVHSAALACALAAAARAEPVEYAFDPAHTFVHFEVRHFGTSTIRGRFGPLAGSVTLDPYAATGRVEVSVATAGVSSGVRVFDSRLREADLLASAEYPQASFVAERFVFDAGRLVAVTGELTLRGVRQPLTLRALRFACAFHPGRALPSPPPEGVKSSWGGPATSCERPQGRASPGPPPEGVKSSWGGPATSWETREALEREVCGGDFEAEVDRSAFGAVFGLPFVADRVRLVIQVEALRQ